jgi:superfamily I DNA/RNA helicase
MRLADPAAAGPARSGEAGLAATGPTGAGEAGTVAARLAAAARRLSGRTAGQASGPRAVDVLAGAEVLAPLARRCGGDLERFFTEIALGAEADALDPRADAVALLTLHAAKGLEFGVVFVAGCERGLLPLWLPGAGGGQASSAQAVGAQAVGTQADRPDRGEERRLLFVGMTRARTHLFLTCAAERGRHGRVSATGPSPFLAAISPALLARAADPPRPRRPADRQLRLL